MNNFYNCLRKPTIKSIDNSKSLKNLNRGYWVYDELIKTLLDKGWTRFAAGFKAGIYAHQKHEWCIKILGMGVGENPLYFAERGDYLKHERNMLIDFNNAGFSFQPQVMTQEEAIDFLIKKCGVVEQQAIERSMNNDIMIMEFFPGIPFLTQTGHHLDCEINPCIMNNGVLKNIGIAIESLGIQLDEANAKGLLHNDPIGFNIVFTPGRGDEIIAKLVDFELAQNLNKQSPGYVNASVEELYKERNVPKNTQTGKYYNNLDQHLIRESIQIVEKLSDKLKKVIDWGSSFHTVMSIGPFSSGIEIKLRNVIKYLRKREEMDKLKKEFLKLKKFAPQKRGFEFEKFLNKLFKLFNLSPKDSFRSTGEQIDGSFQMGNDIYLVEAKWHNNEIGQADLLVFDGKVSSNAAWARGLFISISGFTDEGLKAFSKGRRTSIIGMDEKDLKDILDRKFTLPEAIALKSRNAAETNEFFCTLTLLKKRYAEK